MIKAMFFDVDGTLVSFRTHRTTAAMADALETSMDYLAGRTADPRPYPPIKQKPLK